MEPIQTEQTKGSDCAKKNLAAGTHPILVQGINVTKATSLLVTYSGADTAGVAATIGSRIHEVNCCYDEFSCTCLANFTTAQPHSMKSRSNFMFSKRVIALAGPRPGAPGRARVFAPRCNFDPRAGRWQPIRGRRRRRRHGALERGGGHVRGHRGGGHVGDPGPRLLLPLPARIPRPQAPR